MPKKHVPLPKSPGIYLIKNKINGNQYVGSAKNMNYRYTQHVCGLRHGGHINSHLQNAWIKYGENEFEWTVLEDVEFVEDVKELKKRLLDREQYWIDKLHPEYNILKAAGSTLGFHHSEETKAKISNTTKGIKKSKEHAKHIREGQKGRPLREGEYERLTELSKKYQHLACIANQKKVIVDGVEYESITKAAETYGIAYITARKRLNNPRFPTWQYKDKKKL